MRLRFRENTASGLQAAGGSLQGFAISADGESFVWAEAEIQGDEVVVWSAELPNPTTVRYGWAASPRWANLVNAAGLGAAPFSTEATPGPYGVQ